MCRANPRQHSWPPSLEHENRLNQNPHFTYVKGKSNSKVMMFVVKEMVRKDGTINFCVTDLLK